MTSTIGLTSLFSLWQRFAAPKTGSAQRIPGLPFRSGGPVAGYHPPGDRTPRRQAGKWPFRAVWLAAATLVVAACGPTVQSGGGTVQAPAQAQAPQQALDRFGRPIDESRILVGLLLPLTGRGEEVGASMLNAAQMGMFDAAGDRFELIPMDTGGSPAGAGRAARELVNQGVDIILGPLGGDEVAEVGPIARSAGINVVTYTNDSSRASSNVFVMGVMPETQVDRVVAHSVENGLRRFAVIAPGDRYGRLIAQSMTEAASQRGATVATTAYYNTNGSDILDRVTQVVNSGADAIMIPASGQALQSVASLIVDASSNGAQMLGTGLWDQPSIGDIQPVHGGWFAAPNPNLRSEFESRYRQSFGQSPHRLATLAYDSVAMAAILARQPANTMGGNPFTTSALADPGGFAGLDGIFRFRNNGLIDRGLAILEVTPNGPRLRQDAPVTFVSAGF